MKRKYLAAVLLTAFLADAAETATALELSQYNKLNTVSRIVNDSEVTDLLRKALGSDTRRLSTILMYLVNRIPRLTEDC